MYSINAAMAGKLKGTGVTQIINQNNINNIIIQNPQEVKVIGYMSRDDTAKNTVQVKAKPANNRPSSASIKRDTESKSNCKNVKETKYFPFFTKQILGKLL
jgi:hypothetical protein